MKSRVLAFGCLLVGGVLALMSSAQPWWRATGEGVVVKFTGSQVTGGLNQALGIVALAGILLMLVLRVRGRRLVAAMLFLVGVGLVLAGALRLQPSGNRRPAPSADSAAGWDQLRSSAEVDSCTPADSGFPQHATDPTPPSAIAGG